MPILMPKIPFIDVKFLPRLFTSKPSHLRDVIHTLIDFQETFKTKSFPVNQAQINALYGFGTEPNTPTLSESTLK